MLEAGWSYDCEPLVARAVTMPRVAANITLLFVRQILPHEYQTKYRAVVSNRQTEAVDSVNTLNVFIYLFQLKSYAQSPKALNLILPLSEF